MAWKEVARHPPVAAGPAGPAGEAQEEHLLLLRKAIAAGLVLDTSTCWFVSVCSLRLSPPTSGLAWRGHRRDAQLDGEFASYASRRRLRAGPGGGAHSWTETFLSTRANAQMSRE